jgi:hypothetical protein
MRIRRDKNEAPRCFRRETSSGSFIYNHKKQHTFFAITPISSEVKNIMKC